MFNNLPRELFLAVLLEEINSHFNHQQPKINVSWSQFSSHKYKPFYLQKYEMFLFQNNFCPTLVKVQSFERSLSFLFPHCCVLLNKDVYGILSMKLKSEKRKQNKGHIQGTGLVQEWDKNCSQTKLFSSLDFINPVFLPLFRVALEKLL